MNAYTKEEIQDLTNYIASFKTEVTAGYRVYKFQELLQFFEDHLDEGYLQDGISEPGSLGSCSFLVRLQRMFPDAWYALRMPKDELPLYMVQENDQEYPIVAWRILRGKI